MFECSVCYILAIFFIGVFALWFIRSVIPRRSKPSLVIKNWEKDVVYVCAPIMPQRFCYGLSEYALKVEAYLKIANIKFKTINTFKTSSRGQIPFIELNGTHLPDSNLILDHLQEVFPDSNIDNHLSSSDRASAFAFCWMIEEVLYRLIAYFKYANASEMAEHVNFGGVWINNLSRVIAYYIVNRNKKKLYFQGFGRYTKEEASLLMDKCFTSISEQLGDKKFLFGDKPCRSDVHLLIALEILRMPYLTKHLDYAKFPQLENYYKRMATLSGFNIV